ncbi:MAG TPA: hypothetical protein PLO37_14100 [Candidatus Hydrogenedentes bacterium]|nr:hypothetical protein [Candidatus Hydrogenedentota bacterium]
MKRGLGLIGAISVAALLSWPAFAVVYVDKANVSGVENGDDWGTAYRNIQDAINEAFANGGDDVWVAAGMYDEPRPTPWGNPQVTGSLILMDKVYVYGGFTSGAVDMCDRNWVDNVTTIRPNTTAYHVVVADATEVGFGPADTRIDGFTIEGGTASGGANPVADYHMYRGGGMFCWKVPNTVVIANCVFQNNTAAAAGAGLCNAESSPQVINCTFRDNTVTSTLAEVVDPHVGGAGVFNHSRYWEGGIESTPSFRECRFVGNTATNSVGVACGGGMYNWGADPYVRECLFENNEASTDGGGVCNAKNAADTRVIDLTFLNVILTDNTATGRGGGLRDFWTYSDLTHCTVAGNTAASGGGIYLLNGADIDIVNSIVWNDTPDEIDIFTEFGPPAVPNITYTDINDIIYGLLPTNQLSDPLFESGVHLSAASPCLETAFAGLAFADYDGTLRPQPINGSGAADKGAYERDPDVPVCSSITIDGTPGPTDNPVVFHVFFQDAYGNAEAVSGVDASDFDFTVVGLAPTPPVVLDVVGAGTACPNGVDRDDEWVVTVDVGIMDGTLTLDIVPDGTVMDAAGNALAVGASSAAHTVDTLQPTVTAITRITPEWTRSASVQFSVVFDEAVVNFNDEADISITLTQNPTLSYTSVSIVDDGGGDTYTVTFNGVAGDGSIAFSVRTSTGIEDLVGNSLASSVAGETVNIDQTPPNVVGVPVLQGSPNPTDGSIQFLVTFDSLVWGVDATDFEVTTTGSPRVVTAPSVSNVDTVPGGGTNSTQWLVTVDTGDMEGSIGLRLLDDDTIVDHVGNPLVAGAESGQVHSPVDTHQPTVISVVRDETPIAPPRNAAAVSFIVTFDEDVTGVAVPGNFSVFTGPGDDVRVAPVFGGADTYPASGQVYSSQWIVGVGTNIMEGFIGLEVLVTTNILDIYSNTLGAGNDSGLAHSCDTIQPTADSITHAYPVEPVNNDTLHFQIVFSEDVLHLSADDLVYNTPSLGTLTFMDPTFTPTAGLYQYQVEFTNVAGDGVIEFSVDTATDVTDDADNPLATSVAGQTLTIDNTPPTVSFDAPVGDNPGYPAVTVKVNDLGTVRIPVNYANADSVTLVSTDVSIQSVVPGAVFGWNSPVVTGAGNTARTIEITGLQGDGDIIVTVDPGTSSDIAGNLDLGPAIPAAPFEVDNTGPGVVISPPNPAYTRVGPVVYDLEFTDGATFALTYPGTLTFDKGSGSNGTLVLTDGTTSTPVVTISSCVGNSWLGITVEANAAFDEIGNASVQTVGTHFTVDQTGPAVVSITPETFGPTAAEELDYYVVFDEAVLNFDGPTDVIVRHQNPPGNTYHSTVIIVDSGNHKNFTATVTGIGANAPQNGGRIALQVPVATGVTDLAGNPLFSGLMSAYVVIDKGVVSVDAITPSTVGPTNQDSVDFTVEFSANVENFDPTDLVITPTGTVTWNNTAVTVSPLVPPHAPIDWYTVTVPGIDGDGTLTVGISETNDIQLEITGAGLANTLTSVPVAFDNTGPAVTDISADAPAPPTPTAQDDITFTITFDEDVENFDDASDLIVTVTGTVSATTPVIVPVSPTVFEVTVGGIDGDGTISLSVDMGSDLADGLGNPLSATMTSPAYVINQDISGPSVVSITAQTPTLTKGGTVEFAVVFDEPVQRFNNLTDLVITATGVTYNTTGVLIANAGDDVNYTVTFTNVAGDGSLSFRVNRNSDVADFLNNPLVAGGVGEVVEVDNTGPSIAFSQPSVETTIDGPVEYTVTYTDLHPNTSPITLSGADITIVNLGGGKADPPTVVVQVVATNEAKVTVSNIEDSSLGLGDFAIQVTSEGTWHDLLGNSAPVSGQSEPFTVEAKETLPLEYGPIALVLLALGAVIVGIRRRATSR